MVFAESGWGKEAQAGVMGKPALNAGCAWVVALPGAEGFVA